MQILWNGHNRFVGIFTLAALIIHGTSHIVIGYALQNSVVFVCKAFHKRRIDFLVFLSRHLASVYVVSGDVRTAWFPGQRRRMRLVRRLLSDSCRLSIS